jgi:hypothetical protein
MQPDIDDIRFAVSPARRINTCITTRCTGRRRPAQSACIGISKRASRPMVEQAPIRIRACEDPRQVSWHQVIASIRVMKPSRNLRNHMPPTDARRAMLCSP